MVRPFESTRICPRPEVAVPTVADRPLAVVRRSDGAPQVTYNGHPLYLYEGDQKPGDTSGQGLSAFGRLVRAVPGGKPDHRPGLELGRRRQRLLGKKPGLPGVLDSDGNPIERT
jgi:hypothetical protein